MKRATKCVGIVSLAALVFLPLVFCNKTLEPVKGIAMKDNKPEKVIFDFSTPDTGPSFKPLTDDVMGGISTAEFSPKKSPGEFSSFTGNISLKNFGGFATVRSPEKPVDLTGFEGIEVRLRGDGKTYIFFIKSNQKDDGRQYQAWFTTEAGQWQDVRLPFSEFRPYYRGMKLRLWAKLNPARIQSMGFMIADKQDGAFALDVQTIGAYKKPSAQN